MNATIDSRPHRPVARHQSHALVVRMRPDARLLSKAMLALALLLLTALSLRQLSTPDVVPSSAPTAAFSAERAMAHLEVLAADSRAMGSPGHAAAQAYLIAQLQALGLEPEVQNASVLEVGQEGSEGFVAAHVSNIVARLPGTDSTGAIAIDAHYDSGATGPGASDAGSGVVTTLETLRAILAGPALKNDLIVVFADGEEEGMLGATAFNEQHPWAQDVRLAINFEAAGASGPALLYATGDDDSWVVSEFLSVAPDPRAWSLIPAISRLMPTARLGCDLEEYTERGSAGLGFVYVGDTAAYHTVRDNVDVTSAGSIQQEGGYTLAILRHFGNLDLSDPPHSGDRVFFNILPGVVVHYSAGWVLPLAALITLVVGFLLVVGFRARELTWRGLLAGTLAFLLGILGVVAVAELIWAAIWLLNDTYQVMLIGSYQTTLYVVALSFATIALMATLYLLLRRRVRAHNLSAGVLLGSTLTLWLVSLVAPGASYLIAWPLLFGTLPLARILLLRGRATNDWWQALILAIAAIPALLLVPGTLYQIVGLLNRFEGLMGMPLLGLSMLFVAPLVALLIPQIDFLSGHGEVGRARWVIPVAAGAIAVSLLAWGNVTAGFDAKHPRPNQIAWVLDADTGSARWVSLDRHLDAWTTQFFPADGARGTYDSALLGAVPAYIAEAPSASVAPPEVAVVSDTSEGDVRTLHVRVSSPEGARIMVASVEVPGEVLGLAVDGRSVDLQDLGWARDGSFPVHYRNVPSGGWELTLTARTSQAITIGVEESRDGLPDVLATEVQPRPPEMMPAPGFARDPTIITTTFRFE